MIRIITLISNTQEYAVTPVTVDELKLYLQLEGTAYDDELQAMLWAATIKVEEYTNVSLTAKTVICSFEQRSDNGVRLPLSPLDAVTTAKWKKCPLQLVDATYTILNDGADDATFVGENTAGSMPYPTYRVEYTTIPSTQKALIQSVKVQAGYMYTHRDDKDKTGWDAAAKALAQTCKFGNF